MKTKKKRIGKLCGEDESFCCAKELEVIPVHSHELEGARCGPTGEANDLCSMWCCKRKWLGNSAFVNFSKSGRQKLNAM